MNRTSDTIFRSRRHATLLVVCALIGGLFAVGASASVARAEENTSGPGYTKVWDKVEYLPYHVARGREILHIDTEHPGPDGFWFAYRSSLSDRGIGWMFQPYGLHCTSELATVEWNPWLNQFSCMVDDAKAQAYDPRWDTVTAACREDSGLPWKESRGDTDSACSDRVLGSDYAIRQREAEAVEACAPWEPNRCQRVTYPWMDREPNSAEVFWYPEPDTCTQMPADTMFASHYQGDYVPESGDGTCTGDAPAPNCETAPQHIRTSHQACTGVEPPAPKFYDATKTLTETETLQRRMAVTRWGKARALKARKARRVKRYRYGRIFAARGVGKRFIVRRARVTHSRGYTITETATATADCTRTTSQADADACALERAQAKLAKTASVRSFSENLYLLKIELQESARRHARFKARRKAVSVPTTYEDRQIAIRKAKRRALRKVRYRIRNYR